ncbi:unnamed protein product [Oppiella nova]|uniref:Uncharacterized protein n=1 Tax=Oppiella nova TaxID=334625 RepID=A0A7R9QVA8_9ACAR|nr:unnamed protein product [Oppiella nova]CAG2175695.1 unnamed protein product [Oppiella nova]
MSRLTKNYYYITDIAELYRVSCEIISRDISHLTNYSKHLTTFNKMCPGDQLALIKYGSLEVLILRIQTAHL